MLSRSHGFRDRIVQNRIHHERDKFAASIDETKVRSLVSLYHNGDECRFFRKPAHGSYNLCYFVEFDDGQQWVVRVPLEPCLAFGGKSKLESEIATMQLVAEKTNIPIPRVVAYAYSERSEPLPSFLILEYIEGERLSFGRLQALTDQERSRFYSSLADVYIQLRRLEFPSIGCLVSSPEGDLKVGKKVTSIDTNMQELEGLRPSHIQASYYADGNSLTSASDYVAMLLEIADHAFVQGRSSVLEGDEDGRDALYHLHIFRRFAEQWVDKRLDRGPFVLVHGDLEPFNLLVNQDLEIVSVLDWEWSRVVPLQ